MAKTVTARTVSVELGFLNKVREHVPGIVLTCT